MALGRISIHGSKELQAILYAMKSLDRDTRKHIRQETKRVVDPAWRMAVAEHTSTRPESRVLANTARVAISDQNVTLKAAQIGKTLSGGVKPAQIWYAIEFGADPLKRKYSATSKKGKQFTVNRNTRAQLRPRNPTGYVFYPAVADILPRIAALWAQTFARGINEAFEGKSDG